MRLLHARDAFGGGEQTEKTDVTGPCILEHRDSRRRGIAGGQHRIDHNREALAKLFRHLEVVFHGLQRCLVPVEPDKTHARRGDQFQHAVEQAVARAQNRDERQFAPGQDWRVHFHKRRVDGAGGHWQFARDLIGEQLADFAQELAEDGCGGFLLPHQGQFVLNERVIDDGEIRKHDGPLALRCNPSFQKTPPRATLRCRHAIGIARRGAAVQARA
ncbi:hypothetical protein RV134_350030 [Roseovarius sp. EC-HK134]|nr:hypothetical protein RV420_400306 [Roseovarius sp. EC-SD190]VVT27854.1 hypothetical protein RV134_350030 [Roseovarius sp. EC-HK134]